MNPNNTQHRITYTPSELDEAAVWLARLRAPDRTANVDKGFQRWLSEKPSHAAAFETVSEAWELTGALKRRPFPKLTRWERAGFRSGFLHSTAAVATAAAVIAIGIAFYIHASGVATDIGEQRVLTLEDGTRISLNTASRVVVKYDDHERRVELKTGEALFEVAKQPERPFVVTAGDRRINALGTSFVVRRDEDRLAVTLVEGKVTVSPLASPSVVSKMPDVPAGTRSEGPNESQRAAIIAVGPFTLTPGQRLSLVGDAAPSIDTPAIERITAWRRGQVEFEDSPLADAAAEMNRYSSVKLVIENPQAAALRVNGVFRAGDTTGFAAAVARSYGLGVGRRTRQIVLTGLRSNEALSENSSH